MTSPRRTPSGFLRLGRPEERTPLHVRDRLLARGIKPRKKRGQNFLTRPEIAEKIVDAAGVTAQDTVVEIGPGAGALTGLLAQRAKRVIAIEFDNGLADLLTEQLGDLQRLSILKGDVLEVDLGTLLREGEKTIVVGGVPYAIRTPILEWLIA